MNSPQRVWCAGRRAVCGGVVCVVMVVAPAARAGVVYVDVDATGAGDGSSWADAFTNLAVGLASAGAGDDVWVALGTYPVPDDAGFIVPAGVSLYGGFEGGEGALDERDPAARTHITGFHPQRGPIVVAFSGPPEGTELDGFFLDGTLTHDHDGGGLALLGGSLVVRNCVFHDNIAGSGAGAYVQDAEAEFIGCTFDDNWSQIGDGGAIEAVGKGSLTVTGCHFFSNLCRELQGVPGRGGAIFNGEGSVLRVTGSSFDDNWAYNLGHEIVSIGGAIANFSADAEVHRCFFIRNDASLGGAIGSGAPMLITNCVMTGNRATEPADDTPFETGQGGAIYGPEGVDLTVKNCTIVANWSKHTAGGLWFDGTVDNSIVWGNVSLVEPGDDPEPLVDQQFQGDITMRYSAVAGLFDEGPDGDHPGSIATDPGFVAAPSLSTAGNFVEGDLRLAGGSPCVDAANNFLAAEGVAVDLDGHPRFVDDPAAPDAGVGSPPHIDMGAYERGPAVCAGDVNGDGAVGSIDLNVLLAGFGVDAGGDLDGDGDTDSADLNVLLGAFGTVCGG